MARVVDEPLTQTVTTHEVMLHLTAAENAELIDAARASAAVNANGTRVPVPGPDEELVIENLQFTIRLQKRDKCSGTRFHRDGTTSTMPERVTEVAFSFNDIQVEGAALTVQRRREPR